MTSAPTGEGNDSATRWWRSAVIYQVYIRSFADGDGDGVGDIAGLRSRLPYLADLGVDAVWINPWYPSPMKDAGYDVSDFRDIEPVFGTLAQAEAMIGEGRMSARGLAEVERAKADGRWAAAYPSQSKAEVPDDLRTALDAEPRARALFEALDGVNRYAVLYRVHKVKTPEARARKIADFVSMLARGETIYPRKGGA